MIVVKTRSPIVLPELPGIGEQLLLLLGDYGLRAIRDQGSSGPNHISSRMGEQDLLYFRRLRSRISVHGQRLAATVDQNAVDRAFNH